jgi:hypothetical protein
MLSDPSGYWSLLAFQARQRYGWNFIAAPQEHKQLAFFAA